MAGLSDDRREHLLAKVREARRLAEAAYTERLKPLGLWVACSRSHAHGYDCYVLAADQAHVLPDDRVVRDAIEVALEREAVGLPPGLTAADRAKQSVERYIAGAAFTLLNRMSALRAMEVRGLLDETVARRARYGGRSQREYRIAQSNPSLRPDAVTERALREAFAEAASDIGAVFDPADPYGLLLPDPRSLRELHTLLGEEVTDDDWRADDVLGWVYQYYQDEARREFRTGRGRGERQAADADQMAAINCLYTPHWVVRLLVDNSLGRLLLEQHGRLAEATSHTWGEAELREETGETVGEFCRYLEPGIEPGAGIRTKPLHEIRVLDPACGSGHFLIYAFDVLWRAYREAEPDVAPEEHASAILEHNLFGIDIDQRACELAALGLYLKARSYASSFKPRAVNIVCADVRILDGERMSDFLAKLADDQPLVAITKKLLHDLNDTGEIGSLLKVRDPFEALVAARQNLRRIANESSGEQLRFEETARERTTAEILEALHTFERDATERQDMGGHIFASDAERSVGLLSLLSQSYDVVVMNPPYNKRQELPDKTREYLSLHYRPTQDNVYAAFMKQGLNLLQEGGFLAALTPRGWMFQRQFLPLRNEVLGDQAQLLMAAEFGLGVPSDATVRTAATVIQRSMHKNKPTAIFWELTAPKGATAKENAFASGLASVRRSEEVPDRYQASITEFALVPGCPFAYWAPVELRKAFAKYPPLDRDNARNARAEKIAAVKVGLQTSDDPRFTRRWWEVPTGEIGEGKRWAPFVKGEHYARWYHDPSLVVLWDKHGEEICNFRDANGRLRSRPQSVDFYFREGLTWQRISDYPRRTRYLPAGCIFADKGPSLFLAGLSPPSPFSLLSVLNSSLTSVIMLMLTPERGWEVGQVSLLPIAAEALQSQSLQSAARETHDLHAAWDSGRETSSRFIAPHLAQVALDVPDAPLTGHPLADGFSWPTSEAWNNLTSIIGSPEIPLRELVRLVQKRGQLFVGRIAELETEMDTEVFRCYGLENEAEAITTALRRRLGVTSDGDEGADDEAPGQGEGEGTETDVSLSDDKDEVALLLSWYVRRAVDKSSSAVVPVVPAPAGGLLSSVRELLRADWGEKRAWHLEDEIHDILGCSLEDWVLHEFFPFHVASYRNRPIFWMLWSASTRRGRGRKQPAFACLVDFRRLTADALLLVRGKLVAGALDDLRADAQRLEREATEARLAGSGGASQAQRAAGEAEAKEGELEAFGQALARVLSQRATAEGTGRGSWVARKIAEVTADGYSPERDFGVLVNISPLRDAGVLHPAAQKVK